MPAKGDKTTTKNTANTAPAVTYEYRVTFADDTRKTRSINAAYYQPDPDGGIITFKDTRHHPVYSARAEHLLDIERVPAADVTWFDGDELYALRRMVAYGLTQPDIAGTPRERYLRDLLDKLDRGVSLTAGDFDTPTWAINTAATSATPELRVYTNVSAQ